MTDKTCPTAAPLNHLNFDCYNVAKVAGGVEIFRCWHETQSAGFYRYDLTDSNGDNLTDAYGEPSRGLSEKKAAALLAGLARANEEPQPCGTCCLEAPCFCPCHDPATVELHGLTWELAPAGSVCSGCDGGADGEHTVLGGTSEPGEVAKVICSACLAESWAEEGGGDDQAVTRAESGHAQ